MTYLSRIWLNPLRTGAQRLLRSPQRMHAAVLGGLSGQPVTERVLWRLETHAGYRLELLVLTRSVPSWEHLIEEAGWPSSTDPQALVRDYKPLLDRIGRGREFAFRLRANPVQATRQPVQPSPGQAKRLAEPRPRGVRVPHRTAEHQLGWLTSRVERWGFQLPEAETGEPDVLLVGRERLSFRRGRDRAGSHVVLSTATFQGRLRVVDPDLARRSLLEGVGPARAYGCGLITLSPLATAGW